MSKKWKTLDITIGVEGGDELSLKKTEQNRRDYSSRNNDGYRQRGQGKYQKDFKERENTDSNWRETPRRTQQPFSESNNQRQTMRSWHDHNNTRSFRDKPPGSEGPRSFRDKPPGSEGLRSFRDKPPGSEGPRSFRDRPPGSEGLGSFRDSKFSGNSRGGPSKFSGSDASIQSSKFFGQGTGGLADLARKTTAPINSSRFSRPLEPEKPVRKVESPPSGATQTREDVPAKTQAPEKKDSTKEKKVPTESIEEKKDGRETNKEQQREQEEQEQSGKEKK